MQLVSKMQNASSEKGAVGDFLMNPCTHAQVGVVLVKQTYPNSIKIQITEEFLRSCCVLPLQTWHIQDVGTTSKCLFYILVVLLRKKSFSFPGQHLNHNRF